MTIVTPNDYLTLLRTDFASFLHRCFVHLHPQGGYAHNWHIDLIADHLERVRRGESQRLILCVPPRSLKSICTSVAWPAWILGHDPTRRIIVASYGQELADKLARDTKSIMTSPWYQEVFATRLAPDRSATADFQTTEQGGRMATSVGGGLTGRGGDVIIVDDPMKPDEALSESIRNATNTWFENTLYSRLNDKKSGAMIIVAQRLHQDDLVAHVQAKEPWNLICLPAVATRDETWEFDTFSGRVRHVRREGEALHPEREPLATLEVIRRSIGEFAFSAQYLQDPVPFGGAMIKSSWLRYAEVGEIPTAFDSIMQSWDSANKPSELADYSVCTTWGIKDQHYYLLHVLRKRLAYPDLKRAVHEQAQLWGPQAIVIEDKASGTQLLQELVREGLSQVKGITPQGDKVMRLHAQTAQFENGFVILPKSAPWLDDYVNELISFPMGKYDDQVDSTAQALAWLSEAAREPGIIAYYRKLAEESGS